MNRFRTHRTHRISWTRIMSIALAGGFLMTGCAGTRETLGAAMAYRGSTLNSEQILRDLPYRVDAAADVEKHRLDLFIPDAAPRSESAGEFPTLIFVHGGGWTRGDRNTGIGGIRPYQNIGRYWANQGVGVAVLSYRLQPDVDWHAQVEDLADATKWVRENIASYGGRPNALYVAGHSAGAWLAARLAFDPAAQARAQIDAKELCGAILISGAAFDIRDQKTYELGSSPAYFERRFGDGRPDWETRASIVPLVASGANKPATRIFWAEGEAPTFERQAALLGNALESADRRFEAQRIPGLDHQKIVVSMSLSETPLSQSIRRFFDEADCPARPISSLDLGD